MEARHWISNQGYDRMMALAVYLVAEVPDNKFSMHTWGVNKGTECLVKDECGTVGCAMGWAAVKFDKEIQLEINGTTFTYIHSWIVDGKKCLDGYKAAEVLFGIEYNNAFRLFNAGRPSSRWEIAHSLVRFAKTGVIS